MDRLLRSFVSIERSIQIIAIIGVIAFLGYLGLAKFQNHQSPALPGAASTLQR